MKDGKTNFQQRRAGAAQHLQQPLGYPFQVGETYANRQGNYEVLEIAPPKITVRYEDGGLLVADIAVLARIWDNVQAGEELPEPEPRARPRAAGKPVAQPAAGKLAAQPRAPRQRRSPRD